jgi:triose/dihydroxyacetone kinase / FAD-AMP lyase (cyclizing)
MYWDLCLLFRRFQKRKWEGQVELCIREYLQLISSGLADRHSRIFFSSLSQHLSSSSSPVSRENWTLALSAALDTLYTYTRARPPSRTLIDPLDAFVQAMVSGGSLLDAARKAGDAADATKDIAEAKAGRSAYVEGRHLRGVADPGAVGVKVILEALSRE